MKVNEATVILEGKYSLDKLVEVHKFRKVLYRSNRYFYKFDGVMHRYTFIPIDDNHVKITIRPNRKDVELDHTITFGNFQWWLKDCVDTIHRDKGKRS